MRFRHYIVLARIAALGLCSIVSSQAQSDSWTITNWTFVQENTSVASPPWDASAVYQPYGAVQAQAEYAVGAGATESVTWKRTGTYNGSGTPPELDVSVSASLHVDGYTPIPNNQNGGQSNCSVSGAVPSASLSAPTFPNTNNLSGFLLRFTYSGQVFKVVTYANASISNPGYMFFASSLIQ